LADLPGYPAGKVEHDMLTHVFLFGHLNFDVDDFAGGRSDHHVEDAELVLRIVAFQLA
jgi:hypothetical protein